ncbi:N-myc-interactor [Leptodactylus fuscus]|uniref:N-myc-interactor n=1 Tax=Leptodactylus fuscus TaxID=238119 RepID=UPI003F4E72D2
MDILQQLRKELESWKELCEEEELRKSNITLAKLDADDHQKEAKCHLEELLQKSSEIEETIDKKQSRYNREIQDLERERDELMSNMDELHCRLKQCRKIYEERRSELQVDNKLPLKNINFKKEDTSLQNPSNISYTCQILIQYPYVLQGGQALLTFEKEGVAQGIIDKGRHIVDFDGGREEVQACTVQLGRTVKFEVSMDISNNKVLVSDLPTNLSEETLKDKLELTFYKSNIGGGEIESVEYNQNKNTAYITYLENGVAQRVLKTTCHQLTAGGNTYEVGISPLIEEQLKKLQIFSGICHRTVLLTEIRNKTTSEDDIKDLIEIHFQVPKNGGDEVEHIAFSLTDKLAHFEEDMA